MAKIMTDVALRLYSQTSEMKKGLNEAGTASKKFNKNSKQTGKAVSKSFGDMSKNAGGAMSQMVGGLGTFGPAAQQGVGGFQSLAVGARLLNTALGPIGIIIGLVAAALKALGSYFKGSVDGAQKFASIMGFIKGILGVISDGFIKLGRVLVGVFKEPKEAIKGLWDAIKQGLVNRWQGLLDFFKGSFSALKNGFKGVGQAIKGLFDDEAKKKSKELFGQMKQDLVKVGKAGILMATGLDIDNPVKRGTGLLQKQLDKVKILKQVELDRFTLMMKNLEISRKESGLRREMANLLLQTRDYEGASNKERQAALDVLGDKETEIANMKIGAAEEAVRLQKIVNATTETSVDDTRDLITLENTLDGLYKTRDDKLREIVNRQNEMRSSVQKYIDAGIKGWEDMTRVEADATLKTYNQKIALEKKATDDALALRQSAEQSWVDYQKALNEESAVGRLTNLKAELAAGLILESEYSAKVKDLEKQAADESKAQAIADTEEKWGVITGIADKAAEYLNGITNAIAGFTTAAKNKELKAAGDNATKREAIERKYAKKEQRIAIAQALINGALAATKAFAQTGILGFVSAALVGIQTAAQIAVIKSQAFSEGGIAYGPTMGLVGEYPGARQNPEVIAPLDKLQNILGGLNTGQTSIFRIHGEDLVAVTDKVYAKLEIY